MDLLRYLWTFESSTPPRWGLKNLEFMLVLANDLTTSDLEESYPSAELFSILLEPRPFSQAMRGLSGLKEAMDFIDDYVIKNYAIEADLKVALLQAIEMSPYSFVGALS
jgi:hypothetical protein